MPPKSARLSKISIRSVKVNHETEYADSQGLTESIQTLAARYQIPFGKYFRDLIDGIVDCITVSKDKPNFYFYARRYDQKISISLNESDRIIEFSISIIEAERLTAPHNSSVSRIR